MSPPPGPPALLHHPSARVQPTRCPSPAGRPGGVSSEPRTRTLLRPWPPSQGSRSAVLRKENCTNLSEKPRPDAAETPDPGPELQAGGEFRFQRFVPRSVSPREEQTLNGPGDQKAQKPKCPSVNGESKQGTPPLPRRKAAQQPWTEKRRPRPDPVSRVS